MAVSQDAAADVQSLTEAHFGRGGIAARQVKLGQAAEDCGQVSVIRPAPAALDVKDAFVEPFRLDKFSREMQLFRQKAKRRDKTGRALPAAFLGVIGQVAGQANGAS